MITDLELRLPATLPPAFTAIVGSLLWLGTGFTQGCSVCATGSWLLVEYDDDDVCGGVPLGFFCPMAPGRKREAKGAKPNCELSLGDLVLAKVKGFPAWPAKISRPEDWDRAPDPKKYFVLFFGTAEIAFVAPADIQAFTSEAKNKLSARSQGKTVKYFAQAVKEICEAFEELERKSASALIDNIDIDKSALGCDAPSVDAVEDDAIDVDFKVEIGRDGTNGDSEVRIVGDFGPGLERCSKKQDGMDCQDKHCIPLNGNGTFYPAVSSKKKHKLSNEEISWDDNEEGDVIYPEDSKVVSLAKGLNAGQNDPIYEVERDCQKDRSSPLVLSVRAKHYDGVKKSLTNGHKSVKMSTGSNRKPKGAPEVSKNSSSAALAWLKNGNSSNVDSLESDGHGKDGIRNKNATGSWESSPDLKLCLDAARKKVKKLAKDRKQRGVMDDVQKDAEDRPKGLAKDKLYGRKKGAQLGPATHDAVSSSARSSKRADGIDDAPKGSRQANRKTDSRSSNAPGNKTDNPEIKQSTSHLKAENHTASRVWTGNASTNITSDEDVFPTAKRHRRAFEAISDTNLDMRTEKISLALKNDISGSDKFKSQFTHLHTKRRVVCLSDEDVDEDPKTPIHGGSFDKVDTCSGKVHTPSRISDSIKNTNVQMEASHHDQPAVKDPGGVEFDHSKECSTSAKILNESASPSSDKFKSQFTHLHTKRRAVCLCDEDVDEDPKTPIHGGYSEKVDTCSGKVHMPSRVSDSIKNTNVQMEASDHDQPTVKDPGGVEFGPLKECCTPAKILNEFASPSPEQLLEKRAGKAIAAHVFRSPGKPEPQVVSSNEPRKILFSPKKSKSMSELPKVNRPSIKASGAVIQKRSQTGSGNALGMVSDTLNYCQNQATTQIRELVSSGERSKCTPISYAQVIDSAPVPGNMSLPIERLEAAKDGKTCSLIDLKLSDSALSMKDLIAAAQEKRRKSQFQNSSHGAGSSLLAPAADVPGRSPNPGSAIQPLLSGYSNVLQSDVLGYYRHISTASPSSHGRQFLSSNQFASEEFEERRVSSEHQPGGGSLSGGTEAAVARDAFEGMIETLSRTKESIGRATRLAIDCAKYGIANEVVELLIRKLESEPSFHRKVDLFFLVDSITQCSHSHKGIAGASYIPTVQAALPRLLGAAAPAGAAARENRRQCLKVLRLWLERKILPDSLLRRYMDDIGAPNDDASAGFFLRRPSRAERAIDDPIREMEGMLVDEYGRLACIATCHGISTA
ncbi:ENHANCER OF AG-4 protein [Sarracenia purpurea var. burkii]